MVKLGLRSTKVGFSGTGGLPADVDVDILARFRVNITQYQQLGNRLSPGFPLFSSDIASLGIRMALLEFPSHSLNFTSFSFCG